MNYLRISLANLFVALALCFTMTAQAEVRILLDTEKNEITRLKEKIDPLIQGYFNGVAAGDTEAALAAYDWEPVNAGDMAKARAVAVATMKLLKQQIDANGGLRKVALVGVFERQGYMNDKKKIILEIEFANGFKDISAGIVIKERNKNWRLAIDEVAGVMETYPSLAVAGLRAAMQTAEAYYAAALRNDYDAVNKLTYSAHWGKNSHTHLLGTVEKQIKDNMGILNNLTAANGGLGVIEVRDIALSESRLGTLHRKSKTDDNYKHLVEMTVRFNVGYGNGKTDYNKRAGFILDNGRWQVLLGGIN